MGVDGEEIDVDSRGNAKTPKNKKLKGGPKHFSIGLWWEFAIQTARRILQNKINFMLGFCACFIVVIVVALLITMIGQSPLVLLRLAELSEGMFVKSCVMFMFVSLCSMFFSLCFMI